LLPGNNPGQVFAVMCLCRQAV